VYIYYHPLSGYLRFFVHHESHSKVAWVSPNSTLFLHVIFLNFRWGFIGTETNHTSRFDVGVTRPGSVLAKVNAPTLPSQTVVLNLVTCSSDIPAHSVTVFSNSGKGSTQVLNAFHLTKHGNQRKNLLLCYVRFWFCIVVWLVWRTPNQTGDLARMMMNSYNKTNTY
jgi:hypothetical protein